jgi:lysophospholipase L1-like esterase
MNPPCPLSRRPALRFAGRAFLFVLVFVLPIFVADQAFQRLYPWQKAQDPRERILWDTIDRKTQIVLLGDSVFYSCQVDRPEDLLWNRLSQYTGQTVFPGALSGAMPVDFLDAARHVARTGGDAAVFVNLIPTRFLGLPGVNQEMMNFPQLHRPEWTPTFDGTEKFLEYALSQSFFFSRNADTIGKSLKGRKPESYFGRGNSRNFIWSQRRDYSEDSFERLRRKVNRLDGVPSVSDCQMVGALQSILSRAGFRPVYVLTPLSRDVIAAYSGGEDYATRLSTLLDTVRQRLTAYLDEQGVEYLDLTNAVPSEGFSDLIHTNARGDDLMAQAMADWLAQHPRPLSAAAAASQLSRR